MGVPRVEDMEAVRIGSPSARAAAFATLVDGQLDASYRLATFILGDREEAADATQDAAAHAWQRFDTLRDHERFAAWFQRILVNGCRDRLRRRARRPGPMPAFALVTPDPSASADERQALAQALAELTPEHRAVIALHYLADLPTAEIARRLGERPGTVRSRLHYALRELRAAHDAAQRIPGEPHP